MELESHVKGSDEPDVKRLIGYVFLGLKLFEKKSLQNVHCGKYYFNVCFEIIAKSNNSLKNINSHVLQIALKYMLLKNLLF
jgi:hypothetical protein